MYFADIWKQIVSVFSDATLSMLRLNTSEAAPSSMFCFLQLLQVSPGNRALMLKASEQEPNFEKRIVCSTNVNDVVQTVFTFTCEIKVLETQWILVPTLKNVLRRTKLEALRCYSTGTTERSRSACDTSANLIMRRRPSVTRCSQVFLLRLVMLCYEMLWNKNDPLNVMFYTGLCGRSFTKTCFGETAAGTGRLVLVGDNPKPDPELPGPQAGMMVRLPTTHTLCPQSRWDRGGLGTTRWFQPELNICGGTWKCLPPVPNQPDKDEGIDTEYPPIRKTGGWKRIWSEEDILFQ